jgi:endonuclease/exonuclease/phosphatase (EEP) superfamily protein YafD
MRRNYQVTLDEASPGMVLSDDLRDAQGSVLLPAGVTLSESTINSLRRREVDMLSIQGDELPEVDDAATLEKRKERLQQLFRNHTDDDMATEILRQFIERFRLGSSS